MIARLDSLIGRISMVVHTATVLAVLVLLVGILAGTGALPYGWGTLLPAAICAVGGTLAGTVAGALVTRSRPYLPSSVVTGLILTLVMPATLGWPVFLLAGAAAGASKYLLAWRGRHLLNPAVVGLLVVGFSGAGVSTWWVGTEPLLIPVLIGGLLVLWRARRLGYAAAYAVPAIVLTWLGYVLGGAEPGTALRFAVVSAPTLFLAAFMLSEPVTSPPRAWQRAMVGGIVAIVQVVPLYVPGGGVIVGTLTVTPELALAVGNLVAFACGVRARVRLRLVRRQVRGDLVDLRFAPSRPLRALPGQYLDVDVPQAGLVADARGRRRPLSLASDPAGAQVRLVTRLRPAPGARPSLVKQALMDLPPSGEIAVLGVAGEFLAPRPGRPALLVGAGIGVTPFLSMLEAVASGSLAPGRDWVVLHAITRAEDALALDAVPAGVRCLLVVPPELEGVAAVSAVSAVGWETVVGSVYSAQGLSALVPDVAGREALVSGAPVRLAPLRRALRAAGVRRVRTDVFLGY